MDRKSADRTYDLTGLDCASCATEIQTALQKVDGLETVRVNFATGTLKLNPSYEQVAHRVLKQVTPSVRITAREPDSQDSSSRTPDNSSQDKVMFMSREKFNLLRIILSGILLFAALALGYWFGAERLSVEQQATELPGLNNRGLKMVLILAYLLAGWPVLAGAMKKLFRGKLFNELFLMSVASLGAIVIGEIPEAVAVMLFYAVGDLLQERAVGQSREAIKSIMALRPETARVVSGGGERLVSPEDVEIDDVVEIRAGELVPLDGEIISGESWVDSSALTGEAVPRRVEIGSALSAGFVNQEGRIRMRVIRPFGESSAARILELIENASGRKSGTEKFLSRFAAVYTPFVVVGALLLALLPPLLSGGSWAEWGYRAMVLLVISCPCALVVSVPLGYFAGIGRASREKILVKGANVLDNLKDVRNVVFDKTGTLTEGRFRVREIYPEPGRSRNELMEVAALAESFSAHPIAGCIREEFGSDSSGESIDSYREIRGMGVIAFQKASHGAGKLMAGNARLLEREGVSVAAVDSAGTLVHLASSLEYLGYIVLDDAVKEDSAAALDELRDLGVSHISMLSGDNAERAGRLAAELGLDEVSAELLPEEKMGELEKLMALAAKGSLTAFVGDGLNDAPVIMRSDVGIAMGGIGRDAAIEAADVVLMDDSPLGVPRAVRIARFTRRVVMQNIIFALGVKAVFLAAGALGEMPMWFAVIADVGVTLLAVLNSMRILRKRPDRNRARQVFSRRQTDAN